jgi:signal peptidase I
MSNTEDTPPAREYAVEPAPGPEPAPLELPDGVAEPQPDAHAAAHPASEPEMSPDIAPAPEAEAAEPEAGAAEPAAADTGAATAPAETAAADVAPTEAAKPDVEAEASNIVNLPRRRAKREGDSWWELVKTVFYAVLIAVFVRTVLFQPFNIPSASMENTLLVGDYLFVSKFSYGYSLYSLPWGYWIRRHVDMPGRIFASEPERGDIIVFKYPPDNETDYIKRLIGLPGDRIQMRAGVLYLNGRAVPRVYTGETTATINGSRRTVREYRETLPNGISYITLDAAPDFPLDNTGEYVVPEGHYFLMGDNRDNSNDSREAVGMVPFENLVGRARFIWFSIDETAELFEPWTWFGAIRYDRIATVVD